MSTVDFRKEVSRLEGKFARQPDFEDSTYSHLFPWSSKSSYFWKEVGRPAGRPSTHSEDREDSIFCGLKELPPLEKIGAIGGDIGVLHKFHIIPLRI